MSENEPIAPIRTMAELDRVRAECRAMVRKRAMLSAGAAAMPIPGADLIVDANLLVKLLPDINRRFGLSGEQVATLDGAKAGKVLMIASSLGNTAIGRTVTRQVVMTLLRRLGVRVAGRQFARFVPVLGQAVAAGISFGAMRMVGNAHIDDCYETAKRAFVTASADAMD